MAEFESILFIKDGIATPTEYFCNNCGQLRFSLISNKSKCANCGSTRIITGNVGELDKEKLKNDWRQKIETKDAIPTR